METNEALPIYVKNQTDVPSDAKYAILSNKLYVPHQFVTSFMHTSFTTILEEQGEDDADLRIEGYTIGAKYVAFERGNIAKINKVFSDFHIVDQRSDKPLMMDLQFLGKEDKSSGKRFQLRDNQAWVAEKWGEKGYGVIIAPPRYGKTVVLTSIITRLKQKTIIFAHQIELLEQFRKTIRLWTNIKDLEKECDRPLMGYIENDWSDIDKYEIVLSTWQSWVTGTDAEWALKEYRDAFGLVIVDEVHLAGSECYSHVISKINAKYRCGVTATYYRKDGLDAVVRYMIGPPVLKGVVKQMHCNYAIHHTDIKPPNFYHWTQFISSLVDSTDRNKQIINLLREDCKTGKSILVATSRVAHTEYLAAELRSLGITAEAFNGPNHDREGLLRRARTNKTQVIVAMRKMLLGIDVPRWEIFYNALPTSNEFTYYQECSRIRTPFIGKHTPLIRDFVDDIGAAYGCLAVRKRVYQQEGFTAIPGSDNRRCKKCRFHDSCKKDDPEFSDKNTCSSWKTAEKSWKRMKVQQK